MSASGGLRARGLGKSYRRRPVVRGVDLELRRGEAVGLLGVGQAVVRCEDHPVVDARLGVHQGDGEAGVEGYHVADVHGRVDGAQGPLIHGPDGKKLSKRHGSLGVEEYQQMGYPASGMRNYLARLGWSHGDDEFFTDDQAKDWFGFDGIGKSPARFDFKKLENLCGQHIANSENAALLRELDEFFAATGAASLTEAKNDLFERGMYCLKERAKTYPELIDKAEFILTDRPIVPDEKSAKNLDLVSRGILSELTPHLQNASWDRDNLEAAANTVAAANEIKFGRLAGPMRAALAGRSATPSVFDMMLVLGKDETIARLSDAAKAEDG